MGRTAEEPASASADTLAWVARAEEKQATLWTSTQELRVQLQGGASLVRGQLLLLTPGGPGGDGPGLVFGNADHVPLEQVQRFLSSLAPRESPPPAQQESARAKRARDAGTQTPFNGPSPLFADELLRCATEPARCTSTPHILATVRQLALLHERRLEMQGSHEAGAKAACRRDDHPDDAAWANCLRAAVSVEAAGHKRPRTTSSRAS